MRDRAVLLTCVLLLACAAQAQDEPLTAGDGDETQRVQGTESGERTQTQSAAEHTPTVEERSTGDRVDDVELTARVKAALIEDEQAKARQVDVEARSGVVQLNGFVDSEESKQAAERVARQVSGVSEVRNQLIVSDGDRTLGRAVDDTVIEAKVKSQLAADAGLGTATSVTVEVNNGVVQLSGHVDSAEEKSRAELVASSVEGVSEVRNDIAVER